MIARCGEVRIKHWAHQGRLRCDTWWEPETEWHRAWKNQFPSEWQEVVHFAQDGEKHIADVKTEQEWVLEFQHSNIKPEERQSRDNFYQKLIWVVDGKRRIRDKKQFFEALSQGRGRWIDSEKYPEIHPLFYPEGTLFRDWSTSTSHVFFDFGEDDLWWLLPQSNEEWALILQISRRKFIELHLDTALTGVSSFDSLVKKYDLRPPERNRFDSTSHATNIHPNYFLMRTKIKRRFRL